MPRVRAVLVLLAFLAGTGANAQAPDQIPANVWCGSDYWFSVDKPPGWSDETELGAMGRSLVLTFRPPSQLRDDGNVQIYVMLVLTEHELERDVRVDIRQELEDWVAGLHMLGGVAETRTLEIKHPTLPSAGRQIRGNGATLSAVFVDPLSGRGNALSVAYSKKGSEVEARELELLERTIASIDFDPRRGCGPDADGTWVPTVLPGPSAAAVKPLPREPDAGFDLHRATKGCGLQELFVPIYCRETVVEGDPAVLVYFADGPKSAEVYLQTFTKAVARPFCYEASRYPGDAPHLIFYVENDPVAHEYDCRTQGLGRALPPPEQR